MRKTLFGVVIGLSLAACSGSTPQPATPDAAAPDATPMPPTPDAALADRICAWEFTLTGSFTASAPRPADNQDGCWPVGVWKFTATSAGAPTDGTPGCSPQPTPLAGGYQFHGGLETDPNDPQGPPLETFTYDTDPSVTNTVKVTEGGSGSCAGELDLFSTDGKQVWVFQPETDTTAATTTISGQAEYGEFRTSQLP